MALAKVFGFVLMAVCFIALPDETYTMPNKWPENDVELDQFGLLVMLSGLLQPKSTLPIMTGQSNGCKCTDFTCKCCVNIDMKMISTECCITMSYRPAVTTITIALTIGSKTVIDQTFAVSELHQLCFSMKLASVCQDFYNFKADSKTFTGCTRFSFYSIYDKVASFDIGCFAMNFPKSTARLPAAKPKG